MVFVHPITAYLCLIFDVWGIVNDDGDWEVRVENGSKKKR